MAQYKILIAEGNRQSMYLNRLDMIKKTLLDSRFECVSTSVPDEKGLLDLVQDFDALIVSPGMPVSSKSISKFKKCKCIVSIAVGYDNIDIKLAGEKGITVLNVPDYGTEEVADTAMAFVLNLSRNIDSYNSLLKESDSNWNWRLGIPINRLRDSTLGIIGLGRIGTSTAIKAKAFGFKVCFYDPYKDDGYDKSLGLTRCNSLDRLLPASDIVSVHTPLTEETRGMINKTFFSGMKQNAFLVNTSRGAIFESLDVIEWALKNDKVKGIATDVLPQEPPDMTHTLMKSWQAKKEWLRGRLIISPHAAFYSEESISDLSCKAVETARDFILGKNPRNIVNNNYLKKA